VEDAEQAVIRLLENLKTITVDSEGNIYIYNSNTNIVKKYSNDGVLIATIELSE